MKEVRLDKGIEAETFTKLFNDAGWDVICYHDSVNIIFVDRPKRSSLLKVLILKVKNLVNSLF